MTLAVKENVTNEHTEVRINIHVNNMFFYARSRKQLTADRHTPFRESL